MHQPPSPRNHSRTDDWLCAVENALRTLTGTYPVSRETPVPRENPAPLSTADAHTSAALMRVNHVGEICAQALYRAQLLATRNPTLRTHYEHAARDEADHLAWTHQRLRDLNARPSLLNPLWYAGAFGIGLVAGRVSDAVSLGFVVETEAQVEQHLASHLDRLPAADTTSRAIVEQMKHDEIEHGAAAQKAGAVPLPAPVRWAMRAAAKVMTTTAHYV